MTARKFQFLMGIDWSKIDIFTIHHTLVYSIILNYAVRIGGTSEDSQAAYLRGTSSFTVFVEFCSLCVCVCYNNICYCNLHGPQHLYFLTYNIFIPGILTQSSADSLQSLSVCSRVSTKVLSVWSRIYRTVSVWASLSIN